MAKTYKRAALPACPFSGSDVAIRLMNASQTAQQEAERKLRDGVGIGAARVSNRNTASGGHLQVNVIRADAVDHDSSQTGGRGHQRLVHTRVLGYDNVCIANGLQ